MRSLNSLLIAGTFFIHPSAPPLTPAEAAAIMARLDSPSNLTNVVLAPPEPQYPRPPVVIYKQAPPPPSPKVVFRPLTCCDKYVIRIPRERRK